MLKGESTILFIDEIHNMTIQTTLLIGLVSHYNYPVKIALMTATFNPADVNPFFPDIHYIDIPVSNYPIEEIFLEDSHDPLHNDPDFMIRDIIEKERGNNGIVFRPGVKEIKETISYLKSHFSDTTFLPAYSQLSDEKLNLIFSEPGPKIVVGTSVIESSVTIDDVSFVIDDMLEKIPIAVAGNTIYLKPIIVSRSSSRQRRGRTGRTVPGRNYKLITEDS